MEAANHVAPNISKLAQQPLRDHYLLLEILIYIRCKHKIYVNLKVLTRLSLKQILPMYTVSKPMKIILLSQNRIKYFVKTSNFLIYSNMVGYFYIR